jgi:uncharacterized membrane protein YraQ (UPF0718 family)
MPVVSLISTHGETSIFKFYLYIALGVIISGMVYIYLYQSAEYKLMGHRCITGAFIVVFAGY